jgi:HSP20 family molecular chaperone IbpA
MAFFFPRTVYHTRREPAVSPLYRLLSDMDRLSRRSAAPSPAPKVCYVYRAPVVVQRPWNPQFNVQETADEYILRSRLPGLTKEDLAVNFPEAEKLVVRGRQVEGRAQPGSDDSTSATGDPASATPQPQTEEAATPEAVSPVDDDARSRSSFQATVEDAADEDNDFDVVSDFSENSEEHQPAPEQKAKPQSQPQPQPTVQQPTEQQQQQHPASKPRIVREFSRTFTFPGPVNYNATTANLKDGLLTIVVPKPYKPEPRRVVIN